MGILMSVSTTLATKNFGPPLSIQTLSPAVASYAARTALVKSIAVDLTI